MNHDDFPCLASHKIQPSNSDGLLFKDATSLLPEDRGRIVNDSLMSASAWPHHRRSNVARRQCTLSRRSETYIMDTADIERRLREKRDSFVLKEHASGKSEAWKRFSLIFEKRGDDN